MDNFNSVDEIIYILSHMVLDYFQNYNKAN